MQNLEELIKLRQEIQDKILKNEDECDALNDEIDSLDAEISEIHKHNTLYNNQSIADKLVGRAFRSKYDSNCIYKIISVPSIDTHEFAIIAIRLKDNVISHENYFHYSTNIEIDVKEFDAKFDTVVASLIQINKLKK